MSDCIFVPANEPWTCSAHGGIRTRLDEPQCDRVRPAEPFNDAYLDNLRQSIAEGRYPQGLYNIRRLLATIDALAAAEAAPLDVIAKLPTRSHAVSIYDYRDGVFVECLDKAAVLAALRSPR